MSRELAGALMVRADETGLLARLCNGDYHDAAYLRSVVTVEAATEAALAVEDAERDIATLAAAEGILL